MVPFVGARCLAPAVFARRRRHKNPGQDGERRRDDVFFNLEKHDPELPEGRKGENEKGFMVVGLEQTEHYFLEKTIKS